VKGITKILWIKMLLAEFGFDQNESCQLYCDNKAAISISENPLQHDRTKHVEVDRHFIKEKLEAGIISMPLVRSNCRHLNKGIWDRTVPRNITQVGCRKSYDLT
jgi:hypothetical protein